MVHAMIDLILNLVPLQLILIYSYIGWILCVTTLFIDNVFLFDKQSFFIGQNPYLVFKSQASPEVFPMMQHLDNHCYPPHVHP